MACLVMRGREECVHVSEPIDSQKPIRDEGTRVKELWDGYKYKIASRLRTLVSG